MKSKTSPNICKKTGKVSLTESSASRKTKRYDEITRYYFCDYCKLYHLTHTVYWGKEKQKNEVSEDEIKKRLNELRKLLP